VMGRKNAERFLPLIGTFVFFILFNNLIGLVPGFLPPTDTLKTNAALSGFVLLFTLFKGLTENPGTYIKHFTGPIWWLAWLIFPIEVFSQLVIRPVSLALRLMGNMFADHKLLGTISVLVPLLVPLPFYVLGILVCVVQTLVFSLLSMIYIGEAVSHEAH
jgi:F-type H+-transporting ATPase subunit a